jgi:hypothetical protein
MQSDPQDGVSPHGMSDLLPVDQESVDPVIERMLAERARSHRAPSGLANRVTIATLPSIVPPIYSLDAARLASAGAAQRDAAAVRLRRFAVAASLALLAGVAAVAVFTGRAPRDMNDGATQLAAVPDPAAGLTDSEPVLVSLLAGSEIDPAGADEHPAEAILRMRDASFADMQGEVLLVVSAGAGTR